MSFTWAHKEGSQRGLQKVFLKTKMSATASSCFFVFQTQPSKNLSALRCLLPLRDAPNWRSLSFRVRRTAAGGSWAVPRGPLEVVEEGKRQRWMLYRAASGPRVIGGAGGSSDGEEPPKKIADSGGGGFKQPARESPEIPSEVEVEVEGSGGDQKKAAIWKIAAFVFIYEKIFGSGFIIPTAVVWLGYQYFWTWICIVVDARRGLILDFEEGERIRVYIDSGTYEGIVKRKGNWDQTTDLEDYDGNIISITTENLIHKPIVKLGDNWIWEHIVDCEGWHPQQVSVLCYSARSVLAQHPSTLDVQTHIEQSPKLVDQVIITCKIQAHDVKSFLKVKKDLWTRLLEIQEMKSNEVVSCCSTGVAFC